jgi:hypothetical protein
MDNLSTAQQYNVIVKPEYGQQWEGIVYREYNHGEILVVHPIDDPDITITRKIDSDICSRI